MIYQDLTSKIRGQAPVLSAAVLPSLRPSCPFSSQGDKTDAITKFRLDFGCNLSSLVR